MVLTINQKLLSYYTQSFFLQNLKFEIVLIFKGALARCCTTTILFFDLIKILIFYCTLLPFLKAQHYTRLARIEILQNRTSQITGKLVIEVEIGNLSLQKWAQNTPSLYMQPLLMGAQLLRGKNCIFS